MFSETCRHRACPDCRGQALLRQPEQPYRPHPTPPEFERSVYGMPRKRWDRYEREDDPTVGGEGY